MASVFVSAQSFSAGPQCSTVIKFLWCTEKVQPGRSVYQEKWKHGAPKLHWKMWTTSKLFVCKTDQVNLTWNKIFTYRLSWKKVETFLQSLNCIHRGEEKKKKKTEKFPTQHGLQPNFCISKAVTKELGAYTIRKKIKMQLLEKTPSTWKHFFYNVSIFQHFVVKTSFSPY